MRKKGDKKLLETVRERFRTAVDADHENRECAQQDLEFLHCPGKQWDAGALSERGDRPAYEFNKLRVTAKRIVNDIRANRPQGKVRGVEDSDKALAEIYEGLIRNIWSISDGDSLIDQAAEYQVGGGMGCWRINTRYSDDDTFDQDIVVEPIRNPLCLYPDPTCQDAQKRDARYWFLTTRISKDEFKAKYPKATLVDFAESSFEDEDTWQDEETVRICEYWWREPYTKTLVMLSDGRTVDAQELEEYPQEERAALKVERTREVICNRIMQAIVSGHEVLEGPTEWAGKHFPFVIVYGEQVVIDGKEYWFGLTRFAKDAQRSYNYSRTLAVETVALAPQAKYWATETQAANHTPQWAEAHKRLQPFLLYTPDPMAPGPPVWMPGPQVPAALVNEMQLSSEDIKAVTGIYDASLGARGNETTGVAIARRQQQGEIATFNYGDNIAKGIRRTWEILIDLIPRIYDTERSIRILGTDGAENFAEVNKPVRDPMTGQIVYLNDLTQGKYDVAVTVGPSFTTQRQEAAEIYMALGQALPAIYQVAGDLIFKSLDLPYAEDIAERMQALLPPQIQEMLAQDSPEAQAAMAQVKAAMEQVIAQGQLVQQAAQELEAEKAQIEAGKADIDKGKSEIQALMAKLDKAEADLETAKAKAQLEIAQAMLGLVQKEAGLAQRETALEKPQEAA